MNSLNNKQEYFLSLLNPVYDRLQRFCRALSRNPETAKDLVGETILQAFQSFDTLRHETAFMSFLFTIATRIHRKHFHRKKFWGSYKEEEVMQIPDLNTNPDDAAEIGLLYTALHHLPDKQREAIVLFEIMDMTLEEVRTIQGGTLSGVKLRLLRARQRLTKTLGGKDRVTGKSVSRAEQPTDKMIINTIPELL